MNKRQKKKHIYNSGFENKLIFRHYFATHKSNRKYSTHYLRELYKSIYCAYNFKELD